MRGVAAGNRLRAQFPINTGHLAGTLHWVEKMVALRPSPRSTFNARERLRDKTIQTHTGGRDVVAGGDFSTIRVSPLIPRGTQRLGICRDRDTRALA
jgi:hypothetical protein